MPKIHQWKITIRPMANREIQYYIIKYVYMYVNVCTMYMYITEETLSQLNG